MKEPNLLKEEEIVRKQIENLEKLLVEYKSKGDKENAKSTEEAIEALEERLKNLEEGKIEEE